MATDDWGEFLTIEWRDDGSRVREECDSSGREKYWWYELGYRIDGIDQDTITGGTHNDEKNDLESLLGGSITTSGIAGLSTDDLQTYLHITISHASSTRNKVSFWGNKTDGDGYTCIFEDFVYVDKGGTYTSTTDPDAWSEYTSALLISSLADSVNIGDASGLITEGTFRVDWDRLDNRENWDDSTQNRYNAIENFDVSGSIFLQKEVAQESTTKFYSYSPINTGQYQTDPTFRHRAATEPTFDVFYGEVEENAIKDKYGAYNGDLSQYVSDVIDKLVTKTVVGLNQSKSKYTFKRIDTNRKFKKINASAFTKDKPAEEPESVEASTTRVEPMPPPPDSGVY